MLRIDCLLIHTKPLVFNTQPTRVFSSNLSSAEDVRTHFTTSASEKNFALQAKTRVSCVGFSAKHASNAVSTRSTENLTL